MKKIIAKLDLTAIAFVAAMAVLLSTMVTTSLAHAITTEENEAAYTAEALQDKIKTLQERLRNLIGQQSGVDGRDGEDGYSDSDKKKMKLEGVLDQYKNHKEENKTSKVKHLAEAQALWCEMDWSRPLRVGDRGKDVYALQKFLNSDVFTRVTQAGDGAPGLETDYFGPRTAEALARFQERYAKDVLQPAGLTQGSGYFGDLSQRLIMRLCDETGDDDSEPVENFDVDDIDSVTSQYVDPSPNMADEEYYLYVITLENGKVIKFKHAAFSAPGSLAQALERIGFAGDEDEFLDLVEEIEADEAEKPTVIAKFCRSGDMRFPAGTRASGYEADDGSYQQLFDGIFVCRDGEWINKDFDWGILNR